MQTLIVPDVHERWQTARTMLDRELGKTCDRAVFLGDYFDSFTRSEVSTLQTIRLVQDLLRDPRVHLLLGNHDLHYLWPGMQCAGYHGDSWTMVQTHFSPEDRHKLRQIKTRTFAEVGGFLLSHAGLHPSFLPPEGYSKDVLVQLTNRADYKIKRRELSGLFAIGTARGGWDRWGGPFWLDWYHEFTDDPRLPPQIVGHTETPRAIQRKGRSYNLDTCLRFALRLTEDGHLTQIEVATGRTVAEFPPGSAAPKAGLDALTL